MTLLFIPFVQTALTITYLFLYGMALRDAARQAPKLIWPLKALVAPVLYVGGLVGIFVASIFFIMIVTLALGLTLGVELVEAELSPIAQSPPVHLLAYILGGFGMLYPYRFLTGWLYRKLDGVWGRLRGLPASSTTTTS